MSAIAVTDEALALVEDALLQALHSDVFLLSRTSERIVRVGGKRIRPKVVIWSYRALGGKDAAHVAPMGAAVELLHTASLIHDDINDQSSTRRGQPTANAELGSSLALLMGDYVFVRFLSLMAGFDGAARDLLAACCVAIVEGETRQMLGLGDLAMTEETYLSIVAQKTASLLSACAQLGGMLAQGSGEQVLALADYGRYLGMAFQIRDDTLDFVGQREVLGKPVASDLGQGKMSLATIYALREESDAAALLTRGDLRRVSVLLSECGALEYAMERAQKYVQDAKRCLDLLPESGAKDELAALADFAVIREC